MRRWLIEISKSDDRSIQTEGFGLSDGLNCQESMRKSVQFNVSGQGTDEGFFFALLIVNLSYFSRQTVKSKTFHALC